jgi:hypothetical protein
MEMSDKDVCVMGGGVLTEALKAGLVDEMVLHQVPILLGGGRPFFQSLSPNPSETRVGVDRGPVQIADRETLRELVAGPPGQVGHRRAPLPRAEPVRGDMRRLGRCTDVLEVHDVVNDAVAARRRQPRSGGQHP